MDTIRDDVNTGVDELLSKVNPKLLVANPEKALKTLIKGYMTQNIGQLSKRARSEGSKLAKTL